MMHDDNDQDYYRRILWTTSLVIELTELTEYKDEFRNLDSLNFGEQKGNMENNSAVCPSWF